MDIVTPRSMLPWTFFILVFVLSVPFELVGAMTDLQLMPGLPVSSFIWVCPATAASILVYKQNRTTGVIELLKRSFDYKRIKAKTWLVPTVFLMPGVTVVAYGLMRVTGSPLPAARVAVAAALATFPVVFIAALGEELGWSGYATDPLQQRLSALGAAIFLGLAWVVASLWTVPDEIGARLMTEFYQHMLHDSMGPEAALGTVMRSMALRDRSADPALWAAFQVSVAALGPDGGARA